MKLAIVIFFFSLSHQLCAQEITGVVTDRSANAVPFANIELLSVGYTTTTDADGRFSFKGLQRGIYQLRVSAPSFKTITESIDLTETNKVYLKISLNPAVETLEEVVVEAESEVKIISREPLSITSINAETLQAINTDPVEMLNRTSGVRVRQSGGLGSEVNISIQGAQGSAIRRYYDGLPIKFMSRGLDVNNMPVNQVDRIDVYRGVTPLEVGTDALGGGINIIPKKHETNYLDITYQHGSFNTHRPSVNLFLINDKDFFIGSNFFYNYSDNDYEIDAQDLNEFTGSAENVIEVKRFHSRFESYYGDVSLGVRDKSWADELKFTVIYNDIFREIQTPIQFDEVIAYGEPTEKENGFTGMLDYQLSWLDDQLTIKLKSNYGSYTQTVEDSTRFFYNWFGKRLETINRSGAEIFGRPALIELDREIFLNRTTLKYNVNDLHTITASHLIIDQNREGRNEYVDIDNDPFRFPAFLTQQYAGLEWKADWLKDKLEILLTYKNYHLKAEATSLEDVNSDDVQAGFEQRSVNNRYNGGNAALKYAFTTNFYIRSSFEYAYRLPEEEELFGNQSTIGSNIDLRPEQSDNYNLGFFYRTNLLNRIPFAIEMNGFYRYQRDRIILLASGIDLARFFNEEEVEIAGADAYISIEPSKNLRANLSATFQDVRMRSALGFADRDQIGERLPNLPPFFSNVDVTYEWIGLAGEEDRLALTYYYDFIDQFSSIREASGRDNIANFIPTQNIHSAELTYTSAAKSWSASARVNNIFSDDVYDNWRIQRPGRNFNIKVRYVLD
ncbi:MAG: TonB-dependent receptor [Bacteroidota bacterium]